MRRPEVQAAGSLAQAPRAVALVLLALAATGAAGADENADEGCQSLARPTVGLPEQPVCRPGPVPKLPKNYPPGAPAPTRRGLDQPVATLFNVHSREALTVFPGRLPDEGRLAELFRCRGFGEPGHLDPRLIESALAAAADLGATRVEIISAYRSPKFNDALAKKARRVAAESRHTRGQALDLRLEGIPATRLAAWFWEHFEGGVGTYVGDDFVHIDVGPKRRWRGL